MVANFLFVLLSRFQINRKRCVKRLLFKKPGSISENVEETIFWKAWFNLRKLSRLEDGRRDISVKVITSCGRSKVILSPSSSATQPPPQTPILGKADKTLFLCKAMNDTGLGTEEGGDDKTLPLVLIPAWWRDERSGDSRWKTDNPNRVEDVVHISQWVNKWRASLLTNRKISACTLKSMDIHGQVRRAAVVNWRVNFVLASRCWTFSLFVCVCSLANLYRAFN